MNKIKNIKYTMYYFYFPIIVISLLVFFPSQIQAAERSMAALSDIKGDVFVKKSGGLREFRAYNGMKVVKGDWIKTKNKSSVKILYDEGTEAMLGSDTQITVKQLMLDNRRNISVKLWAGSIWNKVRRSLNVDDVYEIETPTVIMGVRGTLYLVSVEQGSNLSQGEVVEGIIAARKNKEKTTSGLVNLLNMGQQVQVKGSAENMESNNLDYAEFIDKNEASLLIQIVEDVNERTQDYLKEAELARDNFKRTGDLEQGKTSVRLAHEASLLGNFNDVFINKMRESSKSDEIDKVLKDKHKDLDKLKNEVKDMKDKVQNDEAEIQENAKQKGLDDKEVHEIIEKVDKEKGNNKNLNENKGRDTDSLNSKGRTNKQKSNMKK